MTPAQTQPCNFMSPIQLSTKFSLQKLKLTATKFFGIYGQLLCMTVVRKVVKLLYVITKQEAGKLQSQSQIVCPTREIGLSCQKSCIMVLLLLLYCKHLRRGKTFFS